MDEVDTFAIPNSLFALEDRNKLAAAVIKKYASRHAWTDVIMGVLGGVVPGGGIVATAAGVAIQAKVFYQPMVRELADIYFASPDDVTKGIVGAVTGVGAVAEVLVNEFGAEFMQEIFMEIVQDLGLSTGLSWIPVIGKVLSAGMDAAVAKALTWAVGAMTAVYFLNGGHFMGSRKETFVLCKKLAAEAVHDPDGINLNNLPWEMPDLLASMVKQGLRFVIRMVRGVGVLRFLLSVLTLGLVRAKPLSADEIQKTLAAKRMPVRLIEEAVRQGAGQPLAKIA